MLYKNGIHKLCSLSLLLFVYFTRPSTSAAVVIVLFVPCHIQRHGVRWLLLCVWILSRQCVVFFFFEINVPIFTGCVVSKWKKKTTKRPIEIIFFFFLVVVVAKYNNISLFLLDVSQVLNIDAIVQYIRALFIILFQIQFLHLSNPICWWGSDYFNIIRFEEKTMCYIYNINVTHNNSISI